MVEARAKLRNVGISPKKMRLVVDAIRGLAVPQALARLQVIFKRSAPVVAKLLKSAVANAQGKYEVQIEDLLVKSIMVDKARDMKRWRPAAFGSAHAFRKHSSHLEIMVVSRAGAKFSSKDKKQEKIETVDLTKTDKKAPTHSLDTKAKNTEGHKKIFSRGTKLAKGKDNLNVKKG